MNGGSAQADAVSYNNKQGLVLQMDFNGFLAADLVRSLQTKNDIVLLARILMTLLSKCLHPAQHLLKLAATVADVDTITTNFCRADPVNGDERNEKEFDLSVNLFILF